MMFSYIYMVSFDVFFFKQNAAYEMRISDWSSDVCSSDLKRDDVRRQNFAHHRRNRFVRQRRAAPLPRFGPKRDPDFQPRRKEAGRYAQALQQREIGRESSREGVCQYLLKMGDVRRLKRTTHSSINIALKILNYTTY